MLSSIKKYLSKQREIARFRDSSTEEIFTHIYETNKWGNAETRSGKGSTLAATENLRRALPALLHTLGVRTLLDIPCGDFHWMKELDLPLERYLGADIVGPLVAENQRLYGNASREFLRLDLLRDSLPAVEAILCRECLVHFSYEDIALALANMRRSGATWLLTTHFPQRRYNEDIVTGRHHTLNFLLAPFYWPRPQVEIVENYAGKRRGNRCLAVWRFSELPDLQLAG